MHPCIVSGYLFNVGKAATEQVAKTAKQFRETVEEKVTDLHEKVIAWLFACKYTIADLVCSILFLITVICSALFIRQQHLMLNHRKPAVYDTDINW